MTGRLESYAATMRRCVHAERTGAQLAVLHLLHQERRHPPPQKASHIAHARAEAHATHPHTAPETNRALHELIRVLGALPAQHDNVLHKSPRGDVSST